MSCCNPQRTAGTPAGDRTPQSVKRARAEEARERRIMAALTSACLISLLLALASGYLFDPSRVRTAQAVLYFISYITGGYFATIRSIEELGRGKINVDVLMIVAALGSAMVHELPEGAVLLFLFSLSGTLERYVLGWTRRSIEALMDLSPDEAVVRGADGVERRVAVESLAVNDVIIVRPGERIAADGIVLAGTSAVDQAPVTGESIPVSKSEGDPVFAGTLNQFGAIDVRVTARSSESTLARIVVLVEEAQSERADSQRFSEWFGERYTIGVLVASLLVLLERWIVSGGEFGPSFYTAMTVLVAASPCAVVISTPAAILAAIARAAREGVLCKGGAHLEQAAAVRAIAFDKTGTLTNGKPALLGVAPAEGHDETEVLSLAAAAESRSEHPLAKAIVDAAVARGMTLFEAKDVEALVGKGLRATVDGRTVHLGKPEMFLELGMTLPESLQHAVQQFADVGATAVVISNADQIVGVIGLADTLRKSSAPMIAALKSLKIEHMVMLTGDNKAVGTAVGKTLGIEVRAGLLPEQKLELVNELKARYGTVAMVGDGINDAPSLAAASVGISLGGAGTAVALETADVVLMSDDLRNLPFLVELGRKSKSIIVQNLVVAFGVMAVLLLLTLGFALPMPFAVGAHEGSTVLVILNGLRLLGFRNRFQG